MDLPLPLLFDDHRPHPYFDPAVLGPALRRVVGGDGTRVHPESPAAFRHPPAQSKIRSATNVSILTECAPLATASTNSGRVRGIWMAGTGTASAIRATRMRNRIRVFSRAQDCARPERFQVCRRSPANARRLVVGVPEAFGSGPAVRRRMRRPQGRDSQMSPNTGSRRSEYPASRSTRTVPSGSGT